MKPRTRTKLLRRLVFASVPAALLYSGPAATTRRAAAQYPYACDCTQLYIESYTICQDKGGLSSFSCSTTYNGRGQYDLRRRLPPDELLHQLTAREAWRRGEAARSPGRDYGNEPRRGPRLRPARKGRRRYLAETTSVPAARSPSFRLRAEIKMATPATRRRAAGSPPPP